MLYSFFYLLSILAYIQYAKKPSNEKLFLSVFPYRLYLLALLLFSFSLMSKPMAITLPFVLLILDYYPLKRFEIAGRWKLVLIEKIPFIILSLASGLITLKAQSSGNTIIALESVPLSVRILVGFKALIAYIEQMLWPAELIPFYRHPKYASFLSAEYLIPILLVIGISIYCIVVSRKQRALPAIWSYYVVTLLPVLGIIQVGGQAMANRYTYMPSLGPFLLAGLCAGLFYEKIMRADKQQLFRKISFFAVFSFIFFILSSSTIRQAHFWKNSITLWTHEIEIAPNFPEPYSSRGNAYRAAGDYDRALQDLTAAILLDPISDANYYNDRGIVYVNLGRFAEALSDFELAILINPNNPVYYQNREKARIEFKRIWEKNSITTK